MRPSDSMLYEITVEFDENHRTEDENDDFAGWSPVQRTRRTFNIVVGSDCCTMRETAIAYAIARTKFSCHGDEKRNGPPQVVSISETKIDSIIEIHQ